MERKLDIEKIGKSLTVPWIIWGLSLAALAAYLFVALFLIEQAEIKLTESPPIDTLRIILLAVSIGIIVCAKFIRRFLLSERMKKIYVRQMRLVKPAGAERDPAVEVYKRAVIVSLVLALSVGIYGLVLFMVGKSRYDLFLFLLISAAALLYYRPRTEELVDHLQKDGAKTMPGVN